MQQIFAQADKKGLPPRLWVLLVNPAKAFYERLEFRVIEQSTASLQLEYSHQH